MSDESWRRPRVIKADRARERDDRILVVPAAVRDVLLQVLLDRIKAEKRGRAACVRWGIATTITDAVIEHLERLAEELAR